MIFLCTLSQWRIISPVISWCVELFREKIQIIPSLWNGLLTSHYHIFPYLLLVVQPTMSVIEILSDLYAVICKLLHIHIKFYIVSSILFQCLTVILGWPIKEAKSSKKPAGTTQAMASNALLSFNMSIHKVLYATVMKYCLGIQNLSKDK